ncbi:phage tail assembly protein [Bordetella bronchiseptica]|uniref:Phage tail assembly protein n=1 Tax=Bordetella bronchiseptica (strain ATCC BAA-588 / NCTC 13252 / RB50) TaxID=257310 RepID=A0A0H3LU00_BORBR|nr:phage tail assembly protein [Bordetella bronchiseptica]KAK64362.1 hypothetical protein AZ22_3657 [Bordetella bronchiseptica 980-2]KDD64508.1 hypothetical protein L533_3830 [Bordetella bronchiseptica OSU553]AMG89701.1 phage tail assembly protein [Bordetella bronchiseptica]KCV51077.1 hypothetical protein L491_3698 [Bordetella bronchiseptica 3E44]KCV61596.1 hypothetical protein AZ14_3794 [Bordetella bronchiseptica 980]
MTKATFPTTEVGRLVYGIEHDGQMHFDFEVRLPTVADNIAALEEVGSSSGMRVTTAMLVSSIVRLGAIPQEQITYEFLATGLVDEDFDVLTAAQDRLKKKRKDWSESLSTTGAPSSSSDATDTPNPASAA